MRRRDRYVGNLSARPVDLVITSMFTGMTPGQLTAIGSLSPNLPPPVVPPGSSQFSIELWFKIAAVTGAITIPLLNKIDGSAGTGYGANIDQFIALFFTAEDTLGGGSMSRAYSPDASWHYLACTADEITSTVYFDGSAISSASNLTSSGMANAVPLLMGFNSAANDPIGGGVPAFFDGLICRVAFYQSTVLSAGTVSAHFAASGAGYDSTITAETGITSYWPLNETSGSVAHDLAGSNPGTYVGGHTLGSGGPGGSNAVLLDGSSGYVTVPDSPTLNP